MTDFTPIPVLSAEEWDARMKTPLIPVPWLPSPRWLREAADILAKGVEPYPEGKWEAIAADVPLSKRGFGT
jgi:hypothetical protein